MVEIQNVKLELLRPGPAHNQLLSPLTPYLALCGADGPVTVNMPFEHRQLLNRLERLRYGSASGQISTQQREAEVREMGEALGRVLAQVPALLSEIGNARSEGGRLVHLRLSLSAFELGLVPFEFAIAPDGFPQSGSPLFLQSRSPISITREIRRGRPLPLDWNRPPRILFAFASPGDLPAVPAQDHLRALRRAIDPWVKFAPTPEERIAHVKDILTILEGATLEKIREACAATEFTHVHILAHGAPFDQAGHEQYGLALLNESAPTQLDIVDGERLGIALTAKDSSGTTRHRPTVVTLATCDSGNVNTVLTPGGSIAHQLHATGIPWVIASQFPLWMRASSIAAEVLYSGFLSGDDPRWVLYELRQRLRTDSPNTHDWASIVAYATVPSGFGNEVRAFRDKQTRRKLEVKFDQADAIVTASSAARSQAGAVDVESKYAELKQLFQSIRDDLAVWRAELGDSALATERAERLGMSAASEKRIGVLYGLAGNKDDSKKAFSAARDFYRAAVEAQPANHWVITQYLSLIATPSVTSTATIETLPGAFGAWWVAARQLAQWELDKTSGPQQAWALSTLAELTLLGAVYGGSSFNEQRAIQELVGYCQRLREVTSADPFPVFSTRRQFKRYVDAWPRSEWDRLAAAAVQALSDPGDVNHSAQAT
jgi:CHAT domain